MVDPDLLKRRFTNIRATCFAGEDDDETSAYTGKKIDPDSCKASLPARLPPYLRNIRVFFRDKSVECVVDDVGPHHTHDAYWETDEGRPQAEDEHGNKAGIDLTPGVWKELGADMNLGIVRVDWEFILDSDKKLRKSIKNGT